MKCITWIHLLASVTSILAAYDQSNANQGHHYQMSGARLSYGASASPGTTTYVTAENGERELKAVASQPQEIASGANFISSGYSNAVHNEPVAVIATTAADASEHSTDPQNTAAVFSVGNNIYGTNSPEYLYAYTNSGYENNHISSPSSDYGKSGYTLGNDYHSNSYDKFHPTAYSNPISGQFAHTSQPAGKSASPAYSVPAAMKFLVHSNGNPLQPSIISGKSAAVPISQHVQVTKHIPVPIYNQIHVPFQQPVKIPIPRPVFETVTQSIPIQIPISKPYAVPRVQEIKLPIEKMIPYSVDKKVPFPVTKLIPFPVIKHVARAVTHPYPVLVPVYKTILHKIKIHGWF